MTELPPELTFPSRAAFHDWLLAEHARMDGGIWLRFAKKGSEEASVTYAEALQEALRFGWIDGQARRIDDAWYVQRFTPRRARSRWSKINVTHAEAMIAAGEMHPAGLAEVRRAKDDGRWAAAYDPPSRATVPDDLRAALDATPAAAEAFTGLNAANRYAILHRVQDAKRPETRARRIERFVAMLAAGDKPLP